MRPGQSSTERLHNDAAVANMIEYLMISGVIMALLIVFILLVNNNIMEDPANRLVYVAFTDIGNGVSTRMVEVYAIAPADGTIDTKFDIPDEIVGRSYSVKVGSQTNPIDSGVLDQYIQVSRGSVESRISLAGIAASKEATGETTGAGMNRIFYNSAGV
jgi:hypothetical protein